MKMVFLLLLSLPCFAQQQVALQSITGTPPNVTYSFGGSQSQLGSSIVLYYAVVANFVGGSVQSNILTVRNGPITLSANNYVVLGWLPVSGATSYDVLKLTGPTIPSGASSIALHTGLTVTSSMDTGTATSTYTLAAPPPTPVPYISYNSQDYTPPALYVAGIGPIGAGGAGTVTLFSSGNLSPLFTTSVANPTTTPTLSFALDNFLADSIFGNFTGSSAAPSTQAIPACANDGAHALVYPSHTLTCETISSGGTPGGTSGQIQYNNSGAFGGFTASGDATVNTSTGAVSVNNLSHVTNSSLANSGLANPATTPNGQTCTLGSTCNVNSGAAAHSVSINEGSGAAIAGATIGTGGRVLVDQGASADPAFKAVSQDVALTSAGAATVQGINTVPLCTGFTPTTGQALIYTTGSSPNPCYTAATVGPSITVGQGVISSLPSCNSTLNEIYYPTNSYYPQVNCLTGASSWTYLMDGQQVYPPAAAANWTKINGASGTAVPSDSNGAVLFSTSASVLGMEAMVRATPTPPYVKNLKIKYVAFTGTGASSSTQDEINCGVLWTNGTATTSANQVGRDQNGAATTQPRTVLTASFTNFTYSGAANIVGYPFPVGMGSTTYWQLIDDNTNRSIKFSVDGINFVTLMPPTARTSPFTPADYGVFCGGSNAVTTAGTPWALTLLSDN